MLKSVEPEIAESIPSGSLLTLQRIKHCLLGCPYSFIYIYIYMEYAQGIRHLAPNDDERKGSLYFIPSPSPTATFPTSYSTSTSLCFKIQFSHISMKTSWLFPHHELESPALLCIYIAAVYISTLAFSIQGRTLQTLELSSGGRAM